MLHAELPIVLSIDVNLHFLCINIDSPLIDIQKVTEKIKQTDKNNM